MKHLFLLTAVLLSVTGIAQTNIHRTLSVDTVRFSVDMTGVEALDHSSFSQNRNSEQVAWLTRKNLDPLNNGCRSIVKTIGYYEEDENGSEKLIWVDTLIYAYHHKNIGRSHIETEETETRYLLKSARTPDTLWGAEMDKFEFGNQIDLNEAYYPIISTLQEIENKLEEQDFQVQFDVLTFTKSNQIVPINSLDKYSRPFIENSDMTYATVRARRGKHAFELCILFF